MTVIGKILTLLNFFMALVFVGFAFTVNMTNKDPQSKKAFPEALREARESEAAKQKIIDELRREVIALKSNDSSDANEKQTIRNNYEVQIKQQKEQVAQANAAKESAVAQFEKIQSEAKALSGQLDIRTKEIEGKDVKIRELDRTIGDQLTQIAKLTNQSIQYKVKADSLAERAAKLEADLKQMTILYENLQEGVSVRPGAPGALAAPPDDIQGTVVKVAEGGQLVSINIGSDQGLRKGHELEVFRTDPKAEYLGRIRIMEVGTHEAVGKLTTPGVKKAIKEKDIVASKIIGK